MTEHKKRILTSLMNCLRRFQMGRSTLQELQLDLDAQFGAIEIESVSRSVENLSNKIDQCLYTMDESEGNNAAQKLVDALAKDLSAALSE